VAVEKLTRFPIAIACKAQTAVTAIEFVKTEIIAHYGCPKILTVDGGTCFTSSLFKELASYFSIQINYTPAYQPEWNGTVERLNRTIRYALTKTVQGNFSTWNHYLPQILFGIRARISNATGYSPFFLLYGVQPRLPGDFSLVDPIAESNPTLRTIECANLPGYRETLLQSSVSSNKVETFQINDLVMLLDPTIRKKTMHDKKHPRYKGPFKVLEIHDHNTYKIESEGGQRLLIHASRLRKFVPRFPEKLSVAWWVECESEQVK
jgi:hypothetical protein